MDGPSLVVLRVENAEPSTTTSRADLRWAKSEEGENVPLQTFPLEFEASPSSDSILGISPRQTPLKECG